MRFLPMMENVQTTAHLVEETFAKQEASGGELLKIIKKNNFY